MYTFPSRVRYSEIDSESKLTIAALLDFFQDCSSFHSEDIGLGIAYLKEQNLGWVLNSWQIEIDRYPDFGEVVTIGTFPYHFKAFLGYRNFFLQDQEKRMLAKANSIWTLMDLEKMTPVRPPQKMVDGYVLFDRLEMEYLDRKIIIPPEMEPEFVYESILVKAHHIDTNHHVNNGQYVRMALEYLPKEEKVVRLRAEYKKSAMLHDTIIPKMFCNGNKRVVSLCSESDEVYANVEFKTVARRE